MPIKLKHSTLRRSAAALTIGREILETLLEPATKKLLLQATEDEVPPVSRISQLLLQRHGEEVKRQPVRRFVGTAVKQILAAEGFEVAATGVRLPKDEVFTTGAVYRRSDTDEVAAGQPDMLDRLIAILSPPELHRIIELANRRLM